MGRAAAAAMMISRIVLSSAAAAPLSLAAPWLPCRLFGGDDVGCGVGGCAVDGGAGDGGCIVVEGTAVG